MPNNKDRLPDPGPISLNGIANAFYLYKPYSDFNAVDFQNYYGDLIKYYNPSEATNSTNIPSLSDYRIQISNFKGKAYGLPIPLTIDSVEQSSVNLYDRANQYAVSTYKLPLNAPGVPFWITLTITQNGGIIIPTKPTTTSTLNGNIATTLARSVPSINYTLIGGGGGGGGNDSYAGTPGDGGRRISGLLSVPDKAFIETYIGGGGVGGRTGSRAGGGAGGSGSLGGYRGGAGGPAGQHGGSGSGGGGGGATVMRVNTAVIAVAGGGGGGGGGGDRGPGGPANQANIGGTNGGTGGDAGGGKYDDGGGGGGGGGGYNGGAGGPARSGPIYRGAQQQGDRGGLTGSSGSNLIPTGGSELSRGVNGGGNYVAGGGGTATITANIEKATAGGPALVVGVSSDGTKYFNSTSTIEIINNGTIRGESAWENAGTGVYVTSCSARLVNNGTIAGGTVRGYGRWTPLPVPGPIGYSIDGYVNIINKPTGGSIQGPVKN